MQRYDRYLHSATQSLPAKKKKVWQMRRQYRRQGRTLSGRDFFLFFFFRSSFSEDIPDLFGSMAELAAGNTGTKTVVADTDSIVLEGVGKVVVALGHGTDEDGDTLVRVQCLQIILGADHGRLETHGHLAAVGGQVVGDRVLNNLKEFFL